VHILYLHQYFVTRSGIGGTRSYEFARRMVAEGHRVTMVTAADPRVPWRGLLSRRHEINGIEVVEVRGGYTDYVGGTARGYVSRALAFASFAVTSSIAVLSLPRPDVVFATSTPLTIGLPGVVASRWHRRSMVFEVRDLWPEAPIQLGALRNPLFRWAARRLESFIYARSKHVVALSPGMRDGVVAAGVPEDRVTVIPNASDLDLFYPERDGADFRQRLGLDGKFVCTYFGAMGEANDLIPVLQAAKLLQERGEDDIAVVLHGNGKRRADLERWVRDNDLSNVVFSTQVPDKDAVASLVAASDVGMTIYKNVPVLYTCSPNKLFDTFAAGRPAIVNTPGWLQSLVEDNEAGVYAPPDDPEALAECMTYLRDHPDVVERYGRNARALAEREFDRTLLAHRLIAVLDEATR
jgi:glycosyltransferase involved in cell wall biosynthesis